MMRETARSQPTTYRDASAIPSFSMNTNTLPGVFDSPAGHQARVGAKQINSRVSHHARYRRADIIMGLRAVTWPCDSAWDGVQP